MCCSVRSVRSVATLDRERTERLFVNVGIGSRGQGATEERPVPGSDEDSPESDGQQPPGRSGVAGLFDLGRDLVRRGMRSGRSTPGQLSALTVVIVVLAIVVAVVGAVLVAQRGSTTDRLTGNREPLAVAAQELYGALSDADVTAARSFLVAENQQNVVWERYEDDIEDAGTALAKASSDAGTVSDAVAQVQVLNKQLPVYTGLVERARSDRQTRDDQHADGEAATGGKSLRAASELMRSRLLPAAQRLYQINKVELADEQDSAGAFPWVLVTLVIALLAVLLAAQVYLRRRTQRVFNIGLLVGTGAVVVMVLWGGAAITVQSVFVNSGSNTTAQENKLVHSRITALRARADEMFMLLAGEDDERYRNEFTDLSDQLAGPDDDGGSLRRAKNEADHEATDELIDFARDSVRSWLGIHDTILNLLTGDSREQAIELATNTHDGGSSTATFTRLDRHLSQAIDSDREHFRSDISTASSSLTLLAPGIVFLSVIAAMGATIGLRDRIREYG